MNHRIWPAAEPSGHARAIGGVEFMPPGAGTTVCPATTSSCCNQRPTKPVAPVMKILIRDPSAGDGRRTSNWRASVRAHLQPRRSASTIISIKSWNPPPGTNRGWIALESHRPQAVDLGRAVELRVDDDVSLVVEPQAVERHLAKLAHRVRYPCRDDEVRWFVLLEHQPHRPDVVAGEAPVPLGVEVARSRAPWLVRA